MLTKIRAWLDDDWPGYHTHWTPLIQPGGKL